jgi:hypothetical protein
MGALFQDEGIVADDGGAIPGRPRWTAHKCQVNPASASFSSICKEVNGFIR